VDAISGRVRLNPSVVEIAASDYLKKVALERVVADVVVNRRPVVRLSRARLDERCRRSNFRLVASTSSSYASPFAPSERSS
jgi:hypothetical protein